MGNKSCGATHSSFKLQHMIFLLVNKVTGSPHPPGNDMGRRGQGGWGGGTTQMATMTETGNWQF